MILHAVTTRFRAFLISFLPARLLPQQQLGQLRAGVRKHCQHLSTLDQIIPAQMLKRIHLRMVQLFVICDFLHAPKARHPRRVERRVIGSTSPDLAASAHPASSDS
jgi:hypothetical protein